MFCLLSLLALFHSSQAAPPSGYVMNGTDIAVEKVPHVVLLFHNDFIRCGASILTRDVLLTAAHCLFNDRVHPVNVSRLTVEAGISDLINERGQEAAVLSYLVHPNFNTSNSDQDIALLRLNTPLNFTEKVQPATLPNRDRDQNPHKGDVVQISGFGAHEHKGEASDTLRTVDLPVVSPRLCRHIYRNMTKQPRETAFCAGHAEGGTDACTGDSGSGILDKLSGKLVGIVSWGYKCGVRDRPSVNTNVLMFMPWIEDNLSGNWGD